MLGCVSTHWPLCLPVTLRALQKRLNCKVRPCLVLGNLIGSATPCDCAASRVKKLCDNVGCVATAVWSSGVMLYVMLCCQYPVRSRRRCASGDVPPHGAERAQGSSILMCNALISENVRDILQHSRACEMMCAQLAPAV